MTTPVRVDLGGAIPPLLAPALSASFGGIAIGVMLSVTGLLSLVCTWALAETKDRAMTAVPERGEPEALAV